jgi:hypothetical protein
MNPVPRRNRNDSKASSFFCGWPGCPGILLLMLALAGCSSLHIPSTQRKAQVIPQQLSSAPTGPVTPSVLQAQVMRFADTYVATVSQGCDDISAATTNTTIRFVALRWKLQQATAAYNDATGQSPSMNALDMLVLATMARNVVEDYGTTLYGSQVQPLLDAQRNMESNAWSMAESFLTKPQEKELQNLIEQWRLKNPRQVDVGPIRFREFAAALGQAPKQTSILPTSIFSLLYLNPLAGLDPTTAAIEGLRELGERTVYYTQRMPGLLSMQTQLLVYQLAGQPESQQMLANMNQFAAAASAFANTSKQLPQIINDQRQAAIQQVLDGMVSQENKSSELLTSTRLTLNSAAEAATNIDAAIQSLTAFVEFVTPTNSSSTTTGTNSSPPFNVLDYGKAASQIGAAAVNLNTLLVTADQSVQQINSLSQRMTDDANHIVRHAFLLGLALIVILLAGSVVAALTYRVIANKLDAKRKPPEPKP